MIDYVFKDNLVKNKVLDNMSNKFDICVLNKFSGDFSLNVVSGNNMYGYMYIVVQNPTTICISYDGVVVVNTSSDCSSFIPLHFIKGARLQIAGECERLEIKTMGCEFDYKIRDRFIPLLNLVYMYDGEESYLVMCQLMMSYLIIIAFLKI